MEERKFIRLKKEEFGIKEYIKRDLGKGKISKLDIEYTPVGEKIVIHTSKPGLIIGRRGEKIDDLTRMLKKKFKLENPHIEIKEILNPLFDSQIVADDIALALERMGNLKFKVIAYKKLQEIIKAGALGCELRLTGKLPSDRAKSWRFAEGYLKKAGESSKEIDRAQAIALTKTGIIGVKVAIMSPDARIYDRIDINDELRSKLFGNIVKDKSHSEKPEKKKESEVKREKPEKKKESEVKKELKELKDEKVFEEKESPIEGSAMKIEQEIEEGVPEEIIEEEINKSLEVNREKNDKEEILLTNEKSKDSKSEKGKDIKAKKPVNNSEVNLEKQQEIE